MAKTEKEINAELNFMLNQYEKDYAVLNNNVYKRTVELIGIGIAANKAVTIAFREYKYNATVTELIVDSSSRIFATRAAIDEPVIKEYWLDKFWPGDQLKLSPTVTKNTFKIRSTITKQMQLGSSWTKTAQAIANTGEIEANLPKYLSDLVDKARAVQKHARGINGYQSEKANKAYKKAMAEYKAATEKALRNIEKLAQNGAPTSALKKSYQNLVKQTQTLNEAAIQRGVSRAIRNKGRYLADRIARTEFVRANSVIKQLEIDEDDDIVGYKITLNSRHVVTDVCDLHSKANLYGMGSGVKPKRVDIGVPFHPFCM